MPHDKPPGHNYSLRVSSGHHPDCWYLTLAQGPQTFTLYAETLEEKENFLAKVQKLQEAFAELADTLEKQS